MFDTCTNYWVFVGVVADGVGDGWGANDCWGVSYE